MLRPRLCTAPQDFIAGALRIESLTLSQVGNGPAPLPREPELPALAPPVVVHFGEIPERADFGDPGVFRLRGPLHDAGS
jgi:hypothetical protein